VKVKDQVLNLWKQGKTQLEIAKELTQSPFIINQIINGERLKNKLKGRRNGT